MYVRHYYPKVILSIQFRTFGSLLIFSLCIPLGWAVFKCAAGPLAFLRTVFGLPLGKKSTASRSK